jgi:hypothetical protein
MICRFCGAEIAIIPDILRYLGRKAYHDVKATDNDCDGRYHMDCELGDDGEHEPLMEEQ